jgi:PLP dependent protein
MLLNENVNKIRKNIEKSVKIAEREIEEITLVAVTKTVSVDIIKQVISLGITDIGENRVQEAKDKFEQIGDIVSWHMIGRLQKNKVKYLAKFCSTIHSVETVELAQEIDKQAEKNNKIINILIQVDVSGEITKQGVMPDELIGFLNQINKYKNIKVCGLMTMAPFSDNPENSRPVFRRLRELKQDIEKQNIYNIEMNHLSMGMSQDYEIAIQEGATIIRVGSAIFK